MIDTVIVIDNRFLGMVVLGFLVVYLATKYKGWHRELWFWPYIERWRDRHSDR